jgi:hypothetical protein
MSTHAKQQIRAGLNDLQQLLAGLDASALQIEDALPDLQDLLRTDKGNLLGDYVVVQLQNLLQDLVTKHSRLVQTQTRISMIKSELELQPASVRDTSGQQIVVDYFDNLIRLAGSLIHDRVADYTRRKVAFDPELDLSAIVESTPLTASTDHQAELEELVDRWLGRNRKKLLQKLQSEFTAINTELAHTITIGLPSLDYVNALADESELEKEGAALISELNQNPILFAINSELENYHSPLHKDQLIKLIKQVDQAQQTIQGYLATRRAAFEQLELDIQPTNDFALLRSFNAKLDLLYQVDSQAKESSMLQEELEQLLSESIPIQKTIRLLRAEFTSMVKVITAEIELSLAAGPQLAKLMHRLASLEEKTDPALLELQSDFARFASEFASLFTKNSNLIPALNDLQQDYQRGSIELAAKLVDYIAATTRQSEVSSQSELSEIQSQLSELQEATDSASAAIHQQLISLAAAIDLLIGTYVTSASATDIHELAVNEVSALELAAYSLRKLELHLPDIILQLQNAGRDHDQLLALTAREQRRKLNQETLEYAVVILKFADELAQTLEIPDLQIAATELTKQATYAALTSPHLERVEVIESAIAKIIELIVKYNHYDAKLMQDPHYAVFAAAQDLKQVIRILNRIGAKQLYTVESTKLGEAAKTFTGSEVAQLIELVISNPANRSRQKLMELAISRALGLRQRLIDEYNIRI